MTTATATNKATWAKLARKTLRMSWWVVVFVTKLVIFVGLLILKFFEDKSTQRNSDESEKKLKDHDFYFSDPDEPGSEYSGDNGRL